ncbi:MAG: hypothetical protein KF749_01600 [Bacteroidetes bacterium]|nr:hypothetical protein [Bacteroidota bacterium]MCW5896209.1 hypothetical protein [Bacteroidota bacterium]
MKPILFILAVVIAAMVVGCQENGSMNPAANQEPAVQVVDKPSPDIRLPLQGILKDPDHRYSYTQILGTAAVHFEGSGRLVNLTLSVDAELWPPEYPDDIRWIVSSVTTERVKLPAEGGSLTITRNYPISGRSRSILLTLDFQITHQPGFRIQVTCLDDMRLTLVQRHVDTAAIHW